MGLRDSPYRSIQLLIRLKIKAYGNRWDRSDPFYWETVIYNLPGTKGYTPGLPCVMKVRFNSHLACEVYMYMHNYRVRGHSRGMCWVATRRFALLCSKGGLQDVARKRTSPLGSQDLGQEPFVTPAEVRLLEQYCRKSGG